MESTFTGTIEHVEGRQVNTKYGAKTVFDVTIGGKKLSTFKNEIAEEANALTGSTVEAQVREEQKGDYTNYMLLGVKLVNAIGGTTQQTKPAASSTRDPFPIPTTTEKKGWQPEDTARVTKLSCLSTAFQYAGFTDKGDENYAIELAQRLYKIAMGEQQEQPEPVAAVSASEQTESIPW